MFRVPENYRIRTGPYASDFTYGRNGAFHLPAVIGGREMIVIASDGRDWAAAGLEGEPWEHVSVHCFQGRRQYTPTWVEMCAVKDLFWDEEDTVIQLHPPRSEYVNNHANTLHLWRPTQTPIPLPPSLTVGFKEIGTLCGEEREKKISHA